MYEVIIGTMGDRAEAETIDGILFAARTLANDAAKHYGVARLVQHTAIVTRDGQYDGLVTTMARGA